MTQSSERRVESVEREFGFPGKVIQLGLPFAPLPFAKATQGGKEMLGLGGDGLRGRLGQRPGRFERLMITLHLPPFVRARGEVVERQGGLTGDQRTKAPAASFVWEDLRTEP